MPLETPSLFMKPLILDYERCEAEELMKMREYVDVLIPRGGAGLIKTVLEKASIPVIETGTGNCHIYVFVQQPFFVKFKRANSTPRTRISGLF